MSLPLLNFFEAVDLAAQGYAIRPKPLQKWFVLRYGVWLRYAIDTSTQAWTVAIVTSGDFTVAEFARKDWTTTIEGWDGGTFPPCTNPTAASELAAPTGAAAWSLDGGCPLGLATDAAGGSSGGIVTGHSPTDADYFLVRVDDGRGSLGSLLSEGGYERFPLDWRGAGFVVVQLISGIGPGGDASIDRAYFWIRVNGSLVGAMAEPYVFPLDGISALTGALGPALGRDIEYPLHSGQLVAGRDGAVGQPVYGTPSSEFLSIPMKPGDVVNARCDLLFGDGSRRSLFASYTLAGWLTTSLAAAVEFAPSVAATGERHYTWVDAGEDGIDDPGGANDDTYLTHTACYSSDPGALTVHVTPTITGGKRLGPGTLRVIYNGVEVLAVAARTGTIEIIPATTLGPAGTLDVVIKFDQPADQYGPATTFTQTVTYTAPSLCSDLAASDVGPP